MFFFNKNVLFSKLKKILYLIFINLIVEEDWLNNEGENRFSMISLFFLHFWFAFFYKGLLRSPTTLIDYVSLFTSNFFKHLEMSDSSDKTI